MSDELEGLGRAASNAPLRDRPPIGELYDRVDRRRRRRRGIAAVGLALVLGGAAYVGLRGGDDTVQVASEGDVPIQPAPSFDEVPAWQWVDVSATRARDGSTSGYGYRPGSDEIFLYLQNGNTCLDVASCATSNPNYRVEQFAEQLGGDAAQGRGVLDPVNPRNPFAPWTSVFVPSVNGDSHAGLVEQIEVGGADQVMVGALNLDAVLADLQERFDLDPTRIVLAGTGDGALGALLNYERVADAFPAAQVDLLLDSFVLPVDTELLPNCLVSQLSRSWRREFPADWDDYVTGSYEPRLAGVYEYVAGKYPDADLAIVASRGDERVRGKLAAGHDECAGSPNPVPLETYEAGLARVEAVLDQLPAWNVLLGPGTQHGFLLDGRAFTSDREPAIEFRSWLRDIARGDTS